MQNVIIIAVLIAIIAFAAYYIIKAKRRGAKCIGCPSGGGCCSNCREHGEEDE